MLHELKQLQDENKINITGIEQHGFKKGKSTLALGLEIQLLISRALDDSNFVLAASLDLSAAFDVVNVSNPQR